MIGRSAVAGLAALALVVWAGPASPEVLELVGGERIDGALKEATPAVVVVEVGGQTLRLPTDRVRAIYFGPAPPPVPSPPSPAPPPAAEPARGPAPAVSPAGDALQAIKSLRAAVLGGVGLQEYRARVVGTTAVVDRSLAALPEGPESDTIHDAARYYALAASAWNNQGAASRTVWLRKDDALDRCASYQEFARKMREKGEAYYDERVKNYVVIAEGVIAVLWTCASEKISEAETLLAKDKK
jgi:hypothetical protein